TGRGAREGRRLARGRYEAGVGPGSGAFGSPGPSPGRKPVGSPRERLPRGRGCAAGVRLPGETALLVTPHVLGWAATSHRGPGRRSPSGSQTAFPRAARLRVPRQPAGQGRACV